MTLPDEEKRALKCTYKFLCDLLDARETPRVPSDVREKARRLIRHYPANYRIDDLYEERRHDPQPQRQRETTQAAA